MEFIFKGDFTGVRHLYTMLVSILSIRKPRSDIINNYLDNSIKLKMALQ